MQVIMKFKKENFNIIIYFFGIVVFVFTLYFLIEEKNKSIAIRNVSKKQLEQLSSDYNKMITCNLNHALQTNIQKNINSVFSNNSDTIVIALLINTPFCYSCFEKVFSYYNELDVTKYLISDSEIKQSLRTWLRFYKNEVNHVLMDSLNTNIASYNLYINMSNQKMIVPLHKNHEKEIINIIKQNIFTTNKFSTDEETR